VRSPRASRRTGNLDLQAKKLGVVREAEQPKLFCGFRQPECRGTGGGSNMAPGPRALKARPGRCSKAPAARRSRGITDLFGDRDPCGGGAPRTKRRQTFTARPMSLSMEKQNCRTRWTTPPTAWVMRKAMFAALMKSPGPTAVRAGRRQKGPFPVPPTPRRTNRRPARPNCTAPRWCAPSQGLGDASHRRGSGHPTLSYILLGLLPGLGRGPHGCDGVPRQRPRRHGACRTT